MLNFFTKKSVQNKHKKVGEAIQYIIARQDLEMSPGKMAAQCSHASAGMALAFYSHPRNIANSAAIENFRDALESWETRSFGKVVLRAKKRDQLIKICQKLDKANIPYAPIFDACRTELEPEEPNGTVFTCIGVSPMFRDEVPKFLKNLQVFQ